MQENKNVNAPFPETSFQLNSFIVEAWILSENVYLGIFGTLQEATQAFNMIVGELLMSPAYHSNGYQDCEVSLGYGVELLQKIFLKDLVVSRYKNTFTESGGVC